MSPSNLPFGRVLTAMVTPFAADGSLDTVKAGRLARHLVENGSDGLVISGTTGESPTLSSDEKVRLFEAVVGAVGDRAMVVAGTGTYDTAGSVALSRRAAQAGCGGVMAVTPYYNKPTQDGLVAHFEAIADATELPVLVYNIPSRTARLIEVPTMVRLSSHPNIVATKDAVMDLDFTSLTVEEAPDLTVYSGQDSYTLPMMSVGAVGVVSVISHLAGRTVAGMVAAAAGGDYERAAALPHALMPLSVACFLETNPGPVKVALSESWEPVGDLRLPMVAPAEETLRAVLKALAALDGRVSVRITFLGGLGEVGRNCAALEVDGRICLIDCGLMFPEADMLGVDLVFPDWSWVVERSDDVECVVLTHGHEDHVGALGYFLEQVNVPVYGTDLSLQIAGERIKELGVTSDLRPVSTGVEIRHGPFRFTLIPVCHSIPDAVALAFDTPEGVILHSGDFKLDPTPIDDRATDLAALAEFGDRGVRLYLGDSTNAERSGFVPSESSLAGPITDIVRIARGRVIAACFSSHIHRVQQIVDAGVAAGRKVALAGRSMMRNSRIASELEVLRLPKGNVVSVKELLRFHPSQQLLIATGSQGEPFSALSRMSNGTHRQISLEEGDTVLISATPVPGNEKAVSKLVSGMLRLGADVYHGLNSPVHVSGHGARDELAVMLRLVRPEAFVPVHGEYRHLHAHARLANEVGVEQVEVLEDGDRVVMEGDDLWVERAVVEADYVFLDGSSVGGVQTRVLRDRSRLSEAGVVTVSVVIDAVSGELVYDPSLTSWGLVDDPVAVLDAAADEVVELVSARMADGLTDRHQLRAVVRRTVARVVRDETRQRPVVLVEIVEV